MKTYAIYRPNWAEDKNGNTVEFNVYELQNINGNMVKTGNPIYFNMPISDEVYENEDNEKALAIIKAFLSEKGIEINNEKIIIC